MIRLLKTLPVAVVAAFGIAATAYAGGAGKAPDSRLEEAFDSTIVSTYPDGREAELWLKRDGSYTAEGRRHDRSSGTWQIKTDKNGQKLCLRQHAPFPAPFNFCTGVPEGGLDKPWAGKAPTGEATRIRLIRGVYDPARNGKDAKSEQGKAQASRPDSEG
jgi:hypothetical protein